MITVMIVEDHPDYRGLLSELIDDQKDMQCLHIFGTARDALKALENDAQPDIIILDLGLPSLHGLDALPKMHALSPESKIMILTIDEDRLKIIEALARGAKGYILKSDPMDRIVSSLRNIMRGEAPMSPAVASLVLQSFQSTKTKKMAAELTAKEIEVLSALAKGFSRKQVADQLGVSITTIHTHLRHVYDKLEVHNLAGALDKFSQR
jgi:DNA-binding NarL/FixJ family response regulator